MLGNIGMERDGGVQLQTKSSSHSRLLIIHISGVRDLSAREYYAQYALRKAQEADRRTAPPISAEAEEAADLESKYIKREGFSLSLAFGSLLLLCLSACLLRSASLYPIYKYYFFTASRSLNTRLLPPSLPPNYRGHLAIPHRRQSGPAASQQQQQQQQQ